MKYLEIPSSKAAELKKRILDRIQVDESGCWLMGRNQNQYPKIDYQGEEYLAHRLSYALYKGPVPDSMLVRHTCDVRGCLNPDHLTLGTHKDNSEDMVKRGRQRTGAGAATWNFVGHSRKAYSFRFTEPYINWIDEFAPRFGSNRTEVIALMIQALVEGRLYVEPRKMMNPNPFPGDGDNLEQYQDISHQMFPHPKDYGND